MTEGGDQWSVAILLFDWMSLASGCFGDQRCKNGQRMGS